MIFPLHGIPLPTINDEIFQQSNIRSALKNIDMPRLFPIPSMADLPFILAKDIVDHSAFEARDGNIILLQDLLLVDSSFDMSRKEGRKSGNIDSAIFGEASLNADMVMATSAGSVQLIHWKSSTQEPEFLFVYRPKGTACNESLFAANADEEPPSR